MNISENPDSTSESIKTENQIDHSSEPGEGSRVNIRAKLPANGILTLTVDIQNESDQTLHQETIQFAREENGNVISTKMVAGLPLSLSETQSPIKYILPVRSGIGKFTANLWQKIVHHWQMVFFGIAVFTYLITRLVSLDAFPIYFFTDEAVQTVLASDFVRDDLKNYDKEFLPTYFVNGNQYNLSTSVYLQVLPYMLFGKSILVTRGTSVLITILAAVFIGLILRNAFKEPYFWIGTLFLSITPAWFLHSRTAFETALATTFYCVFLYFYMMYRTKSPRYLYAAIAVGALTFYTYSPAQMVMAVTAVFLIFSDVRYHWENRRVVLKGIGLAVLLALPYVRFLIAHPQENLKHLQILDSYWIQDILISQKLSQFQKNYMSGLNPFYWYLPNDLDFSRHLMKDYGHLARWTIPFALVGSIKILRNFREPSNRVVLAALLAAPTGAALVAPGITRALFMVIPAAIMTALGAAAILRWLEKLHLSRVLLSIGMLISLVGYNIYMLQDALQNGPVWYQDYGLGGMQYGARQLFPMIEQYLNENPNTNIILSPSWANGTDIIARFFVPDGEPFELGGIETYMNQRHNIKPGTVFVLMAEEYQQIKSSHKFTDLTIEKVLHYPDGQPGFYFVSMRYADNFDEILKKESAVRKALIEQKITLIGGGEATVKYSQGDMGQVENLFDGDPGSLMRTKEANPMQVIISFDTSRALHGITLRVGGVPTRITVYLYPLSGGEPLKFEEEVGESPYPRDVPLDFGQEIPVSRLEVDILSSNDSEPAHVHVWEIILR